MHTEPILHGTDGVYQETRQKIYSNKPLSAYPRWALENLLLVFKNKEHTWSLGELEVAREAKELLRSRKVKAMLKATGGRKL